MPPMRVALITTSYPIDCDDPSGHFVRTEAHSLIEAGHEVTVLAPDCIGQKAESGIELVGLPHLGLFGWPGALERSRRRPWTLAGVVPFVWRARQAIRERGPFDRLVAHWIVPGCWPISRDYDGQTIVVAHGSDVRLLERLPHFAQRQIVSSLVRPNVTLRCVSSNLASRLRQLASAHRLQNLSLLIEPAALDIPTLATRSDVRRSLNLAPGPVVVIVGRVVKAKRIDIAIEVVHGAFAALASDPSPSLIVIGNGPDRPTLMRRYPAVRWLGQLGRLDTLRYIRAADLLVSASKSEGAPTAVREARALGTKVIAAAAGDLLDWARHDPGLHVTESFVVPPDPQAAQVVDLVRRELERH